MLVHVILLIMFDLQFVFSATLAKARIRTIEKLRQRSVTQWNVLFRQNYVRKPVSSAMDNNNKLEKVIISDLLSLEAAVRQFVSSRL